MRSIYVLGLSLLLCGTFGVSVVEAADIKKLKKEVAKKVRLNEIDAAIQLVREIRAVGGEDAIEALYDIAYRYGQTEKFYDVIVKEMIALEGTVDFLVEKGEKAKRKKDYQPRVFVANVLSRFDSDKSRTALAAMLEDKSDFVRQEAVKGLVRTMHRDAIGPLIDLLAVLSKKRRDVLYHEVVDALWELTEQEFDLIEDWRSWWEVSQATFDPKNKGGDGKTKVRKKRSGEEPDFFGVPVTSKNIVFVIDTSGSMRYVMKNDIPGLASGDGSDGGGSKGGGPMTPENDKLAKFWTRMEMAKRELRKVLMRLDKGVVFNMINFDNETYTFKKGSVVSTPGNKKKALKWAETLRFRREGATNTMDALIQAFKVDGRTNTMFFLSDGLPSKDGTTNDPKQPILDRVFAMNRFRKIKIFTFGYSPESYPYGRGGQPNPDLVAANAFLKELAESTGGKFTLMKVDTKYTPADPFGPDDDPKPKKKKNSERVSRIVVPIH